MTANQPLDEELGVHFCIEVGKALTKSLVVFCDTEEFEKIVSYLRAVETPSHNGKGKTYNSWLNS